MFQKLQKLQDLSTNESLRMNLLTTGTAIARERIVTQILTFALTINTKWVFVFRVSRLLKQDKKKINRDCSTKQLISR